MGYQIVKQPNELYAVWSTMRDNFIFVNASEKEVHDWFAGEAEKHSREDTARIFDKIKSGKSAYYQFTMTWDEALVRMREVHHKKEEVDSLKKLIV